MSFFRPSASRHVDAEFLTSRRAVRRYFELLKETQAAESCSMDRKKGSLKMQGAREIEHRELGRKKLLM